MKRAVIDIGTNSTRLYIGEVDSKVNGIEKHTVITRLGKDVDRDRRLKREGIEKNIKVLLMYKDIAGVYGIDSIKAIATSAVRDAANRNEFIKEVKDRTGIDVDVISGSEEARLGFTGAASVLNGAYGVVVDIGGGSTEFIAGRGNDISFMKSLDIGAVRITEKFLDPDVLKKENIRNAESYIRDMMSREIIIDKKEFNLIGIGGTVTTLAAIDQGLAVYDPHKVHGYKLSKEKVDHLFQMLSSMSLKDRIKTPGLQKERADIIPAGVLILKTAMEYLNSDFIIASECDNLDGLMLKYVSIS